MNVIIIIVKMFVESVKKNVDCHWDRPDETVRGNCEKNTPQPEIEVDTSEGSVKISFETSRLNHMILMDIYISYIKSKNLMVFIWVYFSNKNCITCEKVINELDPK